MLFLIFHYLLLPNVRINSQKCIIQTDKYLNPMTGYLLINFIILKTPKMQLTKEHRMNKLEEH